MPIISLLQRLQQTPQALGQFLNDHHLEADQSATADDNGWQINDVLLHLCDAEKRFLTRFQQMAAQASDPLHLTPFTAEDQTILMTEKTAAQLLADFTHQRESTIQFLKSVSPECWENTAYHASYGQASLHFHVQNMFSHDREHINQAQKIADKHQQQRLKLEPHLKSTIF